MSAFSPGQDRCWSADLWKQIEFTSDRRAQDCYFFILRLQGVAATSVFLGLSMHELRQMNEALGFVSSGVRKARHEVIRMQDSTDDS